MNSFEDLILRWVCLFDDFNDFKQSDVKNLVSSKAFKEFVDNVFCIKSPNQPITDNEQIYNNIKVNYQEFEVENYEDICNEKNSVYTCIVVLLHALLKCTDNKYRNQLSEKMDDNEQVLLTKFLEATQTSLLTKQSISEALMVTSDKTLSSPNILDSFSNNITPVKHKSKRRSYLQEFCESPKSQSLLYQEKEKLIAKLTEDIKTECEENEKLAESVKVLQDDNLKLSNKLEDKEKVIQCLKDEIEELSQPKDSSFVQVDNSLAIKKLNQDMLYLEANNNELKQQLVELENEHKDLIAKFEKKSSNCENLILTYDNIESENALLKESIDVLKKTLQEKDTEITSLKDELFNKSITSIPMNLSSGTNIASSNTLFDELSCVKLEEATRDKEKYRHKYKSVKKTLLNTEHHVKDLDEQLSTYKQQLQDGDVQTNKLLNKFSDKKKELLECQKKNNNLETKIKQLKDIVRDKENSIESMSVKLDKKDDQIKELLVEMDSVKKAKTMIELILSKTNTEIEMLHEENEKTVIGLLTTIEDYKKSDEVSRKSIIDLKDEMKQLNDHLENKAEVITFYENKAAENYQTIGILEEQLKTLYQEKLTLQSQLNDTKTKNETQEKLFNNKIRDMENTLEYHLDELKDEKTNVSKLNEILMCKKNEIDQQNELINYQKNVTETLQSDKCNLETNVRNLNSILEQKSVENKDLKEKIQEFTLSLNTHKEQLDAALNEKTLLEENVKANELQMETLNNQFECLINDMKNRLDGRCNEIERYKMDIEKLKCTLEEKQNDFNEQLILNNHHIESVYQLRLEKKDLEENLKSSDRNVSTKENELKSLENELSLSTLKFNSLSEEFKIVTAENNRSTQNLNTLSSAMMSMDENFTTQILNIQTKMELNVNKINVFAENVLKIKNLLLSKVNELHVQMDVVNEQKGYIISLENRQLDLSKRLEDLDQLLLRKHKEMMEVEDNLKIADHVIVVLEQKSVIYQQDLENIKQRSADRINDLSTQLQNSREETMAIGDEYFRMENTLVTELNAEVELTSMQKEIIEKLQFEKQMAEEQLSNANARTVEMRNEVKSLNENLDKRQFAVLKLEKDLETLLTEKTAVEIELKDCIKEMETRSQQSDEQIQELESYKKDASLEINDLKICINELNNDLSAKRVQIERATEETNQLRKTVDYSENQCSDLQEKLKELNDCVSLKDKSIDLLKAQISERSVLNEHLNEQIVEVKQNLNKKLIELDDQIRSCDEQREIIIEMKKEKDSLCDEIKNLENSLSHKEYECNLSEGKLFDSSNAIHDLEQKLNDMKNEKSSLESRLNETVTRMTDENRSLILQLELKEKNILSIQEELVLEQNKFQKQMEEFNEQTKTASMLNSEKDLLLKEIDKLHVQLDENGRTSECLRKEIDDFKRKNEELQILNVNISSELDENKILLTNLHQESKKRLADMETKYVEVENQLNKRDIELGECISKYDGQMEATGSLARERDNLIEQTNELKSAILSKDSTIVSNREKLLEYEVENNKINAINVSLELKLKQTNGELETTRQDLTKQLEEMKDKLDYLQVELNCNTMDLESQKQELEEREEMISDLQSENVDLTNSVSSLKKLKVENTAMISDLKSKNKVLRAKNRQFRDALENFFQEKLNDVRIYHEEYLERQTQIEKLKIALESERSKSKTQLDNTRRDLAQQLQTSNSKLSEIQEQLTKLQTDCDTLNKRSNDQLELINTLTAEKNNLVDKTRGLNQLLALSENRLQSVEKQNSEIESKNVTLMLELNQAKCHLNDLRQESTKQIVETNAKFCEAQEKLDVQESDTKRRTELKTDGLLDIYRQINDLKTMKNELDLLLKQHKTEFETYFDSINCTTKKPSLLDGHEDSLLEVITSADTFMEQNGIQVAKVENTDENSIMEKIKKIFEAFKMFIVYLNTQGNDQAISSTNVENGSNDEAYVQLLAASNKQLETITNLSNEMARLKSECNYKVSKIQQKTQEYVTSEYEKKFERKREQMKQFCKDLETKMHQDYETKLKKYKEKINKDEIHIKEISQQLWDVSEKYLKLQQQNRRESTMSLPYEMPSFSQTTYNVPKYSSFTLPKACSAGQIRSLVEENSRSNQDLSKRNVPAGIGKIFPKEEDEEGQMFNHSFLADLKQGRTNFNDTNNSKQYNERLSELQARNSLCPPHLRSCYAAETNFLPTTLITEEDIKTSASYSDCESENLIPLDRNKKKDRNQTSYKKPGPPTPSKNGGRVSLSSNQKVASKEPKETTGANKKRTSSTPNKLFSLFMSKK